MTGFKVCAATTPGSAADKPANAMKTSALDSLITLTTLSGVLCADATKVSYVIPNLSKIFSALFAVGLSLAEPITIVTCVMPRNRPVL